MSASGSAAAATRVVIVGGGITGLAAAHRLATLRPDLPCVVLESRRRVGGNILTERRDGFVLDAGPDSFLRTKPDALALCDELGLRSELIGVRPEARTVYVAHRGRLERLPAGLALAVPTRIGPMLKTPLLGSLDKLRMLGDLVLPRRRNGFARGDESIDAFVTRHFGSAAARQLAAPLLGGIYAGDITELSILSTFPQLVDLEAKHGSLVRGFFATQRSAAFGARSARELARWLLRGEQAAESPFCSLREGMGSLVDALAAALPRGSIHTDVEVVSLERRDAWHVKLAGGETLTAAAVLLATPAHVAARLAPRGALGEAFAEIPYVSTATIFFALDRSRIDHPLDGLGFVVPAGEGQILAGTWISSKWDHRVPPGGALIRAFVGGARAGGLVERSDDEALTALARTELERFMGRLGEPRFTRVFRYHGANPQPVVGHAARLKRLARLLDEHPGLHIAGAAYQGVGIPDCVRQGRAAAERILRDRA
jgi:oxygen-dependent protoporphyrinogen oxidase